MDPYIVARYLRRTEDLDGGAARAVATGPSPMGEGQVVVLDAVAGAGGLRGPEGVEVEGVGVGMAGEVMELGVLEGAGAAVGFDHEHLVAVLAIYVLVENVFDVWSGVSGT